tara:strand:- start:787 stop:1047 length:261 start_codon:yes stop_codon:yes gene_type:complete
MEEKVSFGRDGIISMSSSKSYIPVGFIRKVGAEYVGHIFKIENGFADYSNRTNNIHHAIATGTTVCSKKRKDIADKVSKIYAASFQ